MKLYIWVGIVLAFLMMGTTIIGQYRIIKQEDTKQLAIENPAEKKAEVVERVITRTVTKEGKPIEIIKEVIRTVVEKTPLVPQNSVVEWQRHYYVSGTYGYEFTRGFGSNTYGVGVGYNANEWVSCGVRYDTIGPEQRVALEVRINF